MVWLELSDGRVIVVRFPPRLVLAASVLGVFAASSGTALLMPERTEAAVPLPEIAAAPPSQAAAEPQAPEPVAPAATAGPAITGAQIAELALAPARDRAAAIVAERARAEAAEAERARDDRGSRSRADQWQELRDEIREACDDGRLRGQICRGS